MNELKQVPIADITIGDRHRKDLGDVGRLAASMKDIGLLHPVVLTRELHLIVGRRRIEAARRLGWGTIAAYVTEDLAGALELLKAERDENTCREDPAPSEAVALGKALEALERPAAKERIKEAGRVGGKGSGKLPDPSKGDTRDKVASAVGLSGRTYEKAKAVVEAAAAEPERFGDLPARMDRTGKVDPAYQEVKAARGGKPKGTAKADPKGKKKAPRRRLPAGLAAALGRLVLDKAVSEQDAYEVLRALPAKADQQKLAAAGPEAVKQRAAESRWLWRVRGPTVYKDLLNDEVPLSAEARHQALDILQEARAAIDALIERLTRDADGA